MILEFTVKNYRSIENQTFSLHASNKIKEFSHNINTTNNTSLLNSCIIYGRNASGKSNFLNALMTLKVFLLRSDQLKHSEDIIFYQPFEFDLFLKEKPVDFELIFITKDNLKFKYQISFNKEKILFESLYYFPNSKPAKLFVREFNQEISYGEYYTGSRKSIENELLENQLFLSKSATRNIYLLKEVYLFFLEEIEAYVLHESDIDDSFINLLAEMIYENDNLYFKENINNILQASDVNIIDFEVNKIDYSQINLPDISLYKIKSDLIKNHPYTVITHHKLFDGHKEIGKQRINLVEESLGTKRLLLVGGLIIQALSNGGVVIIDELDKGLHPLLTKLLIKLFHSKKTNPYNAQLIFASHDSSLLDNELFRRDQIYFTEKDYEGKTSIYRLSDINGVRKDVPYDRWYLSGRFNAVPIIEDLELKFEPREPKIAEKNAS